MKVFYIAYIRKNAETAMRKFIFPVMCAALFFFSLGCLKSSSSATCVVHNVTDDEPLIVNYLNANSITGYVKHSSGLYYKIETQGSGPVPTASSKIYVKYTGTFLDKTLFDAVTDSSKTGWVLGTLIQGWQIGLPLIQKGGKIMLLVPSALGYGCTATGSIPANSVLVFEVELEDVQ
jgi:FKBP-type peptidyl-prolyl cis-trans isomerase FkpA